MGGHYAAGAAILGVTLSWLLTNAPGQDQGVEQKQSAPLVSVATLEAITIPQENPEWIDMDKVVKVILSGYGSSGTVV
jgi:hypothetical protein